CLWREYLLQLLVIWPRPFLKTARFASALVPLGVVTVNVWIPVPAPDAIVMVTGRFVAVPPVPMVAPTPLPLKVTAEAPVKSVPPIVAERFVPTAPEDGTMLVIAGTGARMVNPIVPLVPLGLVTNNVRVPVTATDAIVTVVGKLVAVPAVPIVAVIPVPL